jgi:predicted ArsR family transcriptional regulator
MKTSRQKVLEYLGKNRAVSAREIARALRMSAADVRHHLRILVSDGRAEETSVRRGAGRGRPEKAYSLSRAALGDNLAGLAEALLTEAGSKVGMEAVGRRLAGDANPASLPIAKRLSPAIEKLNAMNYHARWEAGAEGPRVILGQCPYARLIEAHPELCKMDASLLAELLGRDVEQRAKLSPVCVFVMR